MNNNGTVTLEVAGAQVTLPADILTKLWLEKVRAESAAPVAIGGAPTIGAPWHGGVYAGLSLKDGAPVHLVLLHGEAEDVNWKNAIAWAEKTGGVLPSRIDHLVLFKNLRYQFKKDGWYWSSEEHAEYSGSAWMQDFGYGDQNSYHEGGDGRARAVRQIAVQ